MAQNYNTSLKLGIEEKYSGNVREGSDWFLNLALGNSKKEGRLTAGTETEGEKKIQAEMTNFRKVTSMCQCFLFDHDFF